MDPMQQAKTPAPRPTATATALAGTEDVRKAVRENPVVVVSRKGCCMAHVAHRLLLGQGANPGVLEVGDDADAVALVLALNPNEDDRAKVEKGAAFPLVFIGGKVVVGLDKLMSMHIAGDLVPVLKLAGALWL